jgi:hypothetical protein
MNYPNLLILKYIFPEYHVLLSYSIKITQYYFNKIYYTPRPEEVDYIELIKLFHQIKCIFLDTEMTLKDKQDESEIVLKSICTIIQKDSENNSFSPVFIRSVIEIINSIEEINTNVNEINGGEFNSSIENLVELAKVLIGNELIIKFLPKELKHDFANLKILLDDYKKNTLILAISFVLFDLSLIFNTFVDSEERLYVLIGSLISLAVYFDALSHQTLMYEIRATQLIKSFRSRLSTSNENAGKTQM